MNTMQKQQQNNQNQLDIAFIADESRQPSSDFLSFSEDRSISGISFLNTPNYTGFAVNDPQISGLQSWPLQNIEPFNVCPKRNASIRQQSDSFSQDEQHQKYTKKRINQKMKIVNIKQNAITGIGNGTVSSNNYNSYCLRRKKKQVSYNENTSEEESQRNQLRFLVGEIKERPITRSFKKMETYKLL